jgi:hypothetical protein
VHKNPFDLQRSNVELEKMLGVVQTAGPVISRKADPTVVHSNFNTAESHVKKGHQGKPLADWDIVALEDARRF